MKMGGRDRKPRNTGGKDKDTEPPLRRPEEKHDLSPVKLTLRFWSAELEENKLVLF